MSRHTSDLEVAVTPQFAVPTAHEALARVNRWLHRESGIIRGQWLYQVCKRVIHYLLKPCSGVEPISRLDLA